MTSGPHSHSHDPQAAGDARFDAVAREAHALALDRLSPRVHAQLAQRRRAASAGPRNAGARAWPMLALGSAAVMALAVGLFVLRGNETVAPAPGPTLATAPETQGTPAPAAADGARPQGDASAAPVVAAADPSGASPAIATTEVVDVETLPETWVAELDVDGASTGLDAFEENPDFYLWLGSEDTLASAPESL